MMTFKAKYNLIKKLGSGDPKKVLAKACDKSTLYMVKDMNGKIVLCDNVDLLKFTYGEHQIHQITLHSVRPEILEIIKDF